jgi:hypothetical protein
MSTRAQVAYIDEDMTSIITTYNHYDGYPESLGKALLNHYDSDSKAYEIARSGYISFLDPETGDIDATHKEPPTRIRGEDVDTLLRKFYDYSNKSGADYVYLYAGFWIDSSMYPMTQDKFVAMMMGELEMVTPMYDEEEMMDEGYEAKWGQFLNEAKKDVVSIASSILRDMPNLDVYIDSLKNDVRLNGGEDYYGYDSDDWEEDYNNYMADKMDS